jgi:PAS domain S-box-containing protein
MAVKKTFSQKEVEELQTRLEDAEETLRAIRSGEVDALIVKGPKGEQIYTIQGAETPYRILIEDMQEGALSASNDGTILYGNMHFAQMMEVPLERVVGSSIFDYCLHDSEKLRELINEARSKSVKEEIYLGPVNGRLIPAYISASPILEDHSSRLGIVITDLTAQKQHEEIAATEKLLRESERKLRELADTMPQIIWTASPDGTTEYFNRRWYEFTGNANGDVSVESWKKVLHPDDLDRTLTSWQKAVETGGDYEIEYRFLDHKSNRYFWHLGRAVPVREKDGTIARWYGTCTNIDAQKKAEADRDRLVASERMARNIAESASRMKDNFLATLSHELRTPLNAILGYAQLIRKKGALDSKFVESSVAIIERNARIQADLISDLLDMSRIVSGKIHLEIKTVDLEQLIKDVISSMQPAAEAKDINIKVKISPRLESVPGDPTRIRQIFWNLLSNAIKFTPRAGEVRISAERQASWVEIRVSDTGQGISKEFLPYVFDTFQQADTSTSRRFGGLGLGLSIVRHLTELHKGTVEARSEGENSGTTFIVKFPAASREFLMNGKAKEKEEGFPNDRSNTGSAPFSLRGIRVLVVDDEPDARSLVELILKERDATVVTAGSAKEALQQLKKSRHDILISDVGMPDQDGYELISKVRALPAEDGGLIPAIALTAFARIEDRRKALVSGFQVHLPKPIEPEELTAVVANLSSGQKI